MKNRILQLMRSKGMTQQEFSKATGISPASLSSIFTGRTAPTMKHAEAMHRYFPRLNMSWLLFGEGEMFLIDDNKKSTDLTDNNGPFHGKGENDLFAGSVDGGEGLVSGGNEPGANAYFTGTGGVHTDLSSSGRFGDMQNLSNDRAREAISYPLNYAVMGNMVKHPDIKQRKIVEIRIFFDDGTFETFQGNS